MQGGGVGRRNFKIKRSVLKTHIQNLLQYRLRKITIKILTGGVYTEEKEKAFGY